MTVPAMWSGRDDLDSSRGYCRPPTCPVNGEKAITTWGLTPTGVSKG